MNLVDPTTAQPTVTKAVKPGTPSGSYSDPAQVGAMIQQMYPSYANFDATTLGQRWIDLHTPKAVGGGAGTDMLQAPGSAALTSTDPNQNAPDLSGLSKFASPVKPPAPQVIISGLAGNNPYGQGLTPMTNPVQQPQSKPQAPYLSKFDISKVGF